MNTNTVLVQRMRLFIAIVFFLIIKNVFGDSPIARERGNPREFV